MEWDTLRTMIIEPGGLVVEVLLCYYTSCVWEKVLTCISFPFFNIYKDFFPSLYNSLEVLLSDCNGCAQKSKIVCCKKQLRLAANVLPLTCYFEIRLSEKWVFFVCQAKEQNLFGVIYIACENICLLGSRAYSQTCI